MILAGDVGGTKTTLALFEAGRALREATFASRAHASLESLTAEFMREAEPIERACFGVAGPVVTGVARITNLPWVIDERALASALGAPVTLINDVQAGAYGMLVLPATAFAVVQAGAGSRGPDTIAVIAPGTGLGEALLYWDGVRYHAIASEGGHADFAAVTEDEIELLRHLRARFGHASYERVLSGDGLSTIYELLRARAGDEPAWVTERRMRGDANAVISELALAAEDPVCVAALDAFCAMLGAEAGNVALRGAATGGVIIGGGIAPKIVPALRRGDFLSRFRDKGRFSAWLDRLPVKIALDPRAPLLGAAHWLAGAIAAPAMPPAM